MLENAAALVLSGVAGMQLLLLQLYAAAADRMQQLPEIAVLSARLTMLESTAASVMLRVALMCS